MSTVHFTPARLSQPGCIFSTFCESQRDHVKSAGPGVQWNPFALRTAYRKAHPSHAGYSCWVNIIPASGTPTAGLRFTVQQILDAAFPNMPKRGQAQSVLAAGQKRKRASKRFTTKDQQVRTHKLRHAAPLFEAACKEMEEAARNKWPDTPGNPTQIFSKVPKTAVQDIWAQDDRSDADLVDELVAKSKDLRQSRKLLPQPPLLQPQIQ